MNFKHLSHFIEYVKYLKGNIKIHIVIKVIGTMHTHYSPLLIKILKIGEVYCMSFLE